MIGELCKKNTNINELAIIILSFFYYSGGCPFALTMDLMEGGSFTKIDDIGDVAATSDNNQNNSDNIQDAEVCRVSGLLKYRS